MRINSTLTQKRDLTGFKNLLGLNVAFLVISFFYSSVTIAAVKIEQWATSQGAKVFYVQTQGLPLVDIQVTFDAGSARDGEQHGVAALTADLLEAGAGQWNADQIAQRFENVGARFNSYASVDSSSLTLRSLTEPALLNAALETMQTVLTHPVFAEADFLREKNQTLAEIKQREESPADLADMAFDKAVFGNHPYAYPTLGDFDSVAKLKTTDLKQFYQRYYVAANAMIVIVGDLDKQQAQQTAENLFKGLPIGKKPADLPEVKLPEKASVQTLNFPSSQTHVLVGMPGMSRTDPDYFALYVGNHVLGGSGLVSKLFDEVREKRGLAYSAYSRFTPMKQQGGFTIGLQTKNEQTPQALKVLNDTVNDFINNGITEQELIAAKKNITGGFVMRFDTNSKLANYVTMIGFYGLPLDYLDTFTQKVEALTVTQIKDTFKKRVIPALFQTVTLGGSAQTK
jgi:zinc protease